MTIHNDNDNYAEHPYVLVTGASRGLGSTISEHLADNGYEVFAGMRRPTAPSHPRIHPIRLDVTDQASIDAAAALIVGHTGSRGLAALVNNAAVFEAGPLLDADFDCVDRHFRTNVAGPLAVARAVLPLLRTSRGRIVNISSINGQLPLPYWGLYSASKAALDALSDSLRLELDADGIGVTVLTLGAFDTDIRRRGMVTWPNDNEDATRAKIEAMVGVLDATASPTAQVAAAVHTTLTATIAPANVAVGDGIDDLLALAALPAEVRDPALAGFIGIDLQPSLTPA